LTVHGILVCPSREVKARSYSVDNKGDKKDKAILESESAEPIHQRQNEYKPEEGLKNGYWYHTCVQSMFIDNW
jgi:hypothetical protein